MKFKTIYTEYIIDKFIFNRLLTSKKISDEKIFIEIVLLSECNIIVHCLSNMATAALYMNMNSKSICVEYSD
jgi:hypothetical protein